MPTGKDGSAARMLGAALLGAGDYLCFHRADLLVRGAACPEAPPPVTFPVPCSRPNPSTLLAGSTRASCNLSTCERCRTGAGVPRHLCGSRLDSQWQSICVITRWRVYQCHSWGVGFGKAPYVL